LDEPKITAPEWVSGCAIMGLLVVGSLGLFQGVVNSNPMALIASALAFGLLVFAHILYSRR
jgi:hypothetical protein